MPTATTHPIIMPTKAPTGSDDELLEALLAALLDLTATEGFMVGQPAVVIVGKRVGAAGEGARVGSEVGVLVGEAVGGRVATGAVGRIVGETMPFAGVGPPPVVGLLMTWLAGARVGGDTTTCVLVVGGKPIATGGATAHCVVGKGETNRTGALGNAVGPPGVKRITMGEGVGPPGGAIGGIPQKHPWPQSCTQVHMGTPMLGQLAWHGTKEACVAAVVGAKVAAGVGLRVGLRDVGRRVCASDRRKIKSSIK